MENEAPLILTLKIDDQSFEYFNSLRKEHFPANINYLLAHLTLFHHLPNSTNIAEDLNNISEKQRSFDMQVTGLMKLGGGVAYKFDSLELIKIHLGLQNRWDNCLIPQDKQKLRPHITVQNKVKSEQALILYDTLSQSFEPFKVNAIGFSLWKYLGGPWSKIKDYHFI